MRNLIKTAVAIAADEMFSSFGLMRRSTLHRVGPAMGYFLAGALVGGVAALLLTPYSGKELMARIDEQLDRARERVSAELDQGHDGKRARPSRGHTRASVAES